MTGLERRPLGRTEMKVSSLCLGTMMYGDQMDEPGAFAQMDRCFDHGINFFDTAEIYTVPPKPETQGNSERIVGNWIKARGVREKLILATKVAGRSGFTHVRNGQETRVSPAQIKTALEGSLKRLQTDYVDLYQIHWPDRRVGLFGSDSRGYSLADNSGAVAIAEQLSTLAALVGEGKVRAVGLSNETPWGVMSFLREAEKAGLPRMVSIQNCYNLISRTFEYGLAEIAMEEQIGLLAYSPLGQGVLSGKYLQGARPPLSRWARYGRYERYETPNAEKAVEAYVGLSKEFGVDPVMLALQFVTTRPWVTSNIFGASNDVQLDQVFASLEFEWTDEVQSRVDDLHQEYTNPCP